MMMWIMCPLHLRAVATGIEIHPASFARLPERLDNFMCSACGSRHEWRRSDAWLADGTGAPAGRPRLAALACTTAGAQIVLRPRAEPLVTAYTLH